MVHEARGDYDAADAAYDTILAKAPSHEGAHKRKIALLRCVDAPSQPPCALRSASQSPPRMAEAAPPARISARGRLPAAAAALVSYLETFQADAEAWAELADVYTSLGQYRLAAFCWQELIVAAPGAAPWHAAYAAVLATIGDLEALRLAQKHYAAAVELSDGRDVRALYGAVVAAGALARLGGGGAKGSAGGATSAAVSDEVAELAGARLAQLYAAHAPGKAQLAAAAVAALGPPAPKGGAK
jgi:tetratricopeptide (TPR) repeat protein